MRAERNRPMKLGLIGLGRMGANMSRRWLRHGHTVYGYARHADTVEALVKDGAISGGATSLADLVAQLEPPRVLWLMVPAASVDANLDQLVPLLAAGDVVVDGGNSYYRDDIRRSKALEAAGHPLPRLRHQRRRVGPRARLLPDDRRARRRGGAPRPDLRGAGAGRRGGVSHAGPVRRPGHRRAGLPALRPLGCGPLRQDGPQRHRVRRDGGLCRGAEHLASRRRRV